MKNQANNRRKDSENRLALPNYKAGYEAEMASSFDEGQSNAATSGQKTKDLVELGKAEIAKQKEISPE